MNPWRARLIRCLGVLAPALLWVAPAAAETRSFVIGWFTDANYYAPDGADCPTGINPAAPEFYRKELAHLYSPAEIDRMFNGGRNPSIYQAVATRGNGKDNIYTAPETIADPGMKMVEGRYAYGFNLDGRGAASPHSFEEPDTHEKGINNQVYRVSGCLTAFRNPPPARPLEPEFDWDINRRLPGGAWVISITGADLEHDGDVTVTIDRSLDRVALNASGEAGADMTYRIDPDPRSHNELRGRIAGHVLTTEPALINVRADPYVRPEFRFLNARTRLILGADGTLKGLLGGYVDWYALYWSYAAASGHENMSMIDMPAFYYALKNNADAYPNPKTGRNAAISMASRIDAVAAFVVGRPSKVAEGGR